MKVGSDIKAVVARSVEEVNSIRSIWEQIQQAESKPVLDANIDRYLTFIELMKEMVQPHVIILYDEGQPKAMVIGRIEKHKIASRLGYKNVFNPELKCLTVVYGGILGKPDSDLCSSMISNLQESLKNGEFDMIFFNHLKTNTSFYKLVRTRPVFWVRDHFPWIEKHWRMSVPEQMDQFYAGCSRKHRGNLRRYIRKLDELSSGKENFIRFEKENEVCDFLQIAAEISKKTYQNALGAGIVNDERTRDLLRNAARQGWFNGCILNAAEQPCAFQLGLNVENTYYLVSIGYDPAYGSYNAGTVLFLKVLESLCTDPSTDTIDFYFGDAKYKQQYGTEKWTEASVYVFAPRFYPVLINLTRNSIMGLDKALQYLVNRVGLDGWIKRQWRSLLRLKSSAGKV